MMNITEMINEAKRCLNCKHKPCQQACPAHNPIPELMMKIKNEELESARNLWHQSSVLSDICGILCPHEVLCVGHCTLDKIKKPIQIGTVEASLQALFPDVVDYPNQTINHRHLVIGLGPAGIANALKMAELGYIVEAIDRNDAIGGAVEQYVPDFRFDQSVLKRFQNRFEKLNIKVRSNITVGLDVFLPDLMKEYDSIFISTGLDLPMEVDIEQEDVRIYYAIDLLNRELYQEDFFRTKLGNQIGIIGLGNVAIDMARTLVRYDKEVHVIYRRTLDEAPASKKEIMDAIDEGVIVHELFGPVSFKKQNQVKILDCDKTCLIKDETSNRSIVKVVEGEKGQFVLDDLIFATGQISSQIAFKGSDITYKKGSFLTNYANIFVGGDLITKDKRIVDAMVTGLEVATYIKENL